MTISRDAPIWRKQAQQLRSVAQHCNNPKLRDELQKIAADWMRRTVIATVPVTGTLRSA